VIKRTVVLLLLLSIVGTMYSAEWNINVGPLFLNEQAFSDDISYAMVLDIVLTIIKTSIPKFNFDTVASMVRNSTQNKHTYPLGEVSSTTLQYNYLICSWCWIFIPTKQSQGIKISFPILM